ncbi:phage tail assembly chaperone G [Alicyclobacillus shizuokensis]|uniref:phage tail assembly chaperone G n=1 Tax=Alicyclobacillus shizuokensis TaxID=392014 RepID=UPI00082A9C36|nr:hypothetical protein [Alicyclobacillus shizuokensis]
MDIKLLVNGERKTYTVPFVKARMLRRALELAERLQGRDDNSITLDELDMMADFVVELFNGQFTRDDLYEGLPANELVPTVAKYMQLAVGGKDPNGVKGRS